MGPVRTPSSSTPLYLISKNSKLLKVAIQYILKHKRGGKINIVLQYKLKSATRWKDYKGKKTLEKPVSNYNFRLLSSDKKKVLVKTGSYARVMKRFRQIEFFKHR